MSEQEEREELKFLPGESGLAERRWKIIEARDATIAALQAALAERDKRIEELERRVKVETKKREHAERSESKLCGDHAGKGYGVEHCILCDFEHRHMRQYRQRIATLEKELASAHASASRGTRLHLEVFDSCDCMICQTFAKAKEERDE